MQCKKCGKSISEFEIYCNDCKDLLKKEKELEDLIIENKELNKFEITKEVETLQNFKDDNKEMPSSLKEELKDLVNIEELETNLKEKNNGKVIIIVSIIIAVILTLIITILLLFNEEKPKEIIEEKIDYEKILNEYGDKVSLTVSNYLKTNREIPSWSIINDLNLYEKHEVKCIIHNIYDDGTVYLDKCTIDNKAIEYSYGNKQEEKEEGKKVEIFKKEYDNYYSYSDTNAGILELVGTITCKTDTCEYVNAYDSFVLIKENNEYYLYDYENKNIEFGPFELSDENNMLSYQNKLYGILYKENDSLSIYNTNTGKTLKNLKGDMLSSMINFNPNIMYEYGYVILKSENINNFINLKTGNISYKITGVINNFIEDNINKIVYITTLNSNNSKITIYNSNGKDLFDGKEYNDIQISDGKLIVSDDNNFYVYNSKLNLEVTSKDYNILGLYNGFVVVVNNEYLEILDFNDNILNTFDLKWDNQKHSLDINLTGLYGNEIKLIVNQIDTKKVFEYYYNKETKESKVTELSN